MQLWTFAAVFLLIVVSHCSADVLSNVCRMSPPEDVNIEEVIERLQRELVQRGSDHEVVLQPPLIPCTDGPAQVQHIQPNTLYWPSIHKGSCQNLLCPLGASPCYVHSSTVERVCRHVLKIINGVPVYQGLQEVAYLSHTRCRCKECGDINTAAECSGTCPEGKTSDSFCFWTPHLTTVAPNFEFGGQREGRVVVPPLDIVSASPADAGTCRCCEPRECVLPQIFNPKICSCVCAVSCPIGQVQDPVTCGCSCPEGSKPSSTGDCVGHCENVHPFNCEAVKCSNNTHLNCMRQGRSCVCPSCGDVKDVLNDCTLTRCIEQGKSMPLCKIHICDGARPTCRCPECYEQPTRRLCVNTFCDKRQCLWDHARRSCSCPSGN